LLAVPGYLSAASFYSLGNPERHIERCKTLVRSSALFRSNGHLHKQLIQVDRQCGKVLLPGLQQKPVGKKMQLNSSRVDMFLLSLMI